MSIKQKGKSLKASGNELTDSFFQLKVLNDSDLMSNEFMPFSNQLKALDIQALKPFALDIFQLNIGKLCNQTCAHCHVDAGPDRKLENMNRETLELCLDIIKKYEFKTVDITGGAPEMNPNFKWFVEKCSNLGAQVIDRCNLTIIQANPKYRDLPDFFAANKVKVVSSLPYFSKSRTDSQRGDGVFEDSIKSLRMLNEVGYGKPESGLQLDLVYNPSGAFLPSDQHQLEQEFKRQLKRKFDIDFNNLFAITNLPISRFLDYLLESGNYKEYMEKLIEAFNPHTINGLMCRNMISVSWDGFIYDCDFNQMLDLKVQSHSKHIAEFDFDALLNRSIVVNQHCYGCTAGAGSSCGGEIA